MLRVVWHIVMFIFYAGIVYAQNSLQFKVLDDESGDPIIGANVFFKGTTIGAVTDSTGTAYLQPLPQSAILVAAFVGYEDVELHLDFPVVKDTLIVLQMKISFVEGEEIIVNSTRGSRTIQDVPTRIEAITGEELDEKATMNSANIAMLLRETTGIQVQQTSQNSGNVNIRIQGLDGRYTQILKDGFPVFGGFSGGLSIMQIPPLDLKQVEVIKGSSSTLYGGGAIAGLVNLIAKTPENEPELIAMFNQTSALGSTLNGFYSEKYGSAAMTFYGSGTFQSAFDAEDDKFSNIPHAKTVSLNPVFYWYGADESRLRVGVNALYDDRTGGYMKALDKGFAGDAYTEENISGRYTSQLSYDRRISEAVRIAVKNSISHFDRTIKIPGYRFHGRQTGSYSEFLYSISADSMDWVFGGNVFTDSFKEPSSRNGRNYQDFTTGIFAQNTWRILSPVMAESGIRIDHNNDFGAFFLPRLAVLVNISRKLSLRAGGGMGYKIPNIFTEEAERLLFRNILPINPNGIKSERSRGMNVDINYRAAILNNVGISVNQLFFLTELKNSLILADLGGSEDAYSFINALRSMKNKGMETNLKLSLKDYSLYLNYAYIDAPFYSGDGYRQKPLTAKHSVGCVLMYEVEDRWRAGLEVYYTGSQNLPDYSKATDYWIAGLMIMREFDRFSIFLNFENFIDTKQSDYGQVVRAPVNNPRFSEIWAPMEGFVANGGFKIRMR